MHWNKSCGGRALGIAAGITALVLMLADAITPTPTLTPTVTVPPTPTAVKGDVNGAGYPPPDPNVTDLVSENIGFRLQDYHDSQGITNITYNSKNDKLILSCNLKGQDSHLSNGEIVLDLKYVPTIESHVPINMTEKTITVDVDVPSGFIGPSSSPNGIQIFVKDEHWKSQYGTWKNIISSGKATLTFKPSTVNPVSEYTDTGFDPTKIRTIGLKFGINSESTHKFSGNIDITKFEVSPPLPSTPLPEMPNGRVPIVNNISLKADGFYSDGNKWFIVGGNWRLIEYGQNFGATAWFPKGNGASLHRGYISTRLKLFRDAGVTLIRVGLLDDGRTMFDVNGNIIGYDEKFREDVSTLLDLAAENDIKVEFVLLDFLVAGKEENVDGVWVRGRREIIENQTKRTQFITNFLEPFLTEFRNHSALFGFDLLNEPEWIISKTEGGGWEDVINTDSTKATSPVSLADVNSYFNESTNTIHQLASDEFISVGVSIKFINLTKDLDLNYTALHYYPDMGELDGLISGIPKSKVWLLEEYPGNDSNISITSYLKTINNTGGGGALLWSLSPGIDNYSYTFEEEEKKLLEVRVFAGGVVVSIANITGLSFQPQTINVSAGTIVTWTNLDSVLHTVTSDTGLFDSGSLSTGQTFSRTFNTAGNYDYHCSIHPSTTGRVAVSAPSLVFAITPDSRNAQVGTPVTIFMSVINGGTANATNVNIAQASSLPATVSYQQWNGTAFTGSANTPVDIPASSTANFVLTINATAAFDSSSMTFNVSSANGATAVINGVNTLTISASAAPSADVIMMSTSLAVSTPVNTPASFAVATSNVGTVAATGVSLVLDIPSTITGLAYQVNQTNATTGAIIGPATGLTINVGATPTFAVFLSPTQPIAYDPANNRITLQLVDGSGKIIGAQSVAVSTT